MADRKPAPVLDPAEHPHVFSPSQIETANLCLRKWGFNKIDKLEDAGNAATELGGLVHGQLERYLEHATPIEHKKREGKIAMVALGFLPPPKVRGMRIENWFYRKGSVATYWGLKDVSFRASSVPYFGGTHSPRLGIPKVYDHKTTKSFQWAKNDTVLLSDTQAGIYAWDAMEEDSCDEADLQWTYMTTQGAPKSLVSAVTMTRMHAEDVMADVEDTASVLVQLRKNHKKGEAKHIRPTYTACGAFGGCPYQNLCGASAQDVLLAMAEQKTLENSDMSVLEELRNRKKRNQEAGAAEAVSQKIEEDKKETKDQVNPPERAELDQPPPPDPVRVGGKWFSASWDDAEFRWVFPPEYQAAVKAEEERVKAAEKAAEKEAEKAAKAAEKEAKKGSRVSSTMAQLSSATDNAFDAILDQIATRVADKVIAALKP